jgi:hypothetical protein
MGFPTSAPDSSGQDAASFADVSANPPVVVQGAGTVGPYDYVIISVDPTLPSPAEAGKAWLVANGFDVSAVGANLLSTYLTYGQNLLAFKLTKNATVGSIRPVIMTYDSTVAVIPIRPTAIAAQNDMGILVFVYGASRAVPTSYDEIVIPDEAINWASPAFSYRNLVSTAVDAAGGHAFVTELAGDAPTLGIGSAIARSNLSSLQGSTDTDLAVVEQTVSLFRVEEGLADALIANGVTARMSTSLEINPDPEPSVEVPIANYIGFPFGSAFLRLPAGFDLADFLADVDAYVVKPLEDSEALLGRRDYVTRLFTTADPAEMTIDPVFAYTTGLPDVSNVRTATIVSRCVDHVTYQFTRFASGRSLETTVPPTGLPQILLQYDYSSSGAPTLVQNNATAVVAFTRATDRYPANAVIENHERSGSLSGRCSVGGAFTTGSAPTVWFGLALAGLASARLLRRRARAN